MPDLIYLLVMLACPIGMGVMMLMMMRGAHGNHSSAPAGDEVAQLRAEVERLRAQRSSHSSPADRPPTLS